MAHLLPVKVAEGWDNAIFRLGNELAVRLPRRAASAKLIEHEQRWLPHLSSRLPVPVPVPVRVGVPSQMFGRAWSVVRWLPGQSLFHAASMEPVATRTMLERFLRTLHQPAPADAPRNAWRGVPLYARTAALHEHLEQLGGAVDRAAVLGVWDRALSASPWPGPPLWLHGDLHPGNLLISDGRLAGVIDFGDLTSGDPATDIAVRWMLPRSMRERFNAWATGDESQALRMRARGWALALGVAYLAHSRGDAEMASLGHNTVNAALDEP
ncbi:MAG TPA: aminoglycoside phosphotransferase family protein [Xanthobacteraceae bacterium]|nr:aminoglycoside phosphotransferase family protein [Xanthobacteraceae bacterium]